MSEITTDGDGPSTGYSQEASSTAEIQEALWRDDHGVGGLIFFGLCSSNQTEDEIND